MTATTAVLDFTNDDTLPDPLPRTGSREPVSYGSKGGIMGRPPTSQAAKQIRQRARRKLSKLSPDEMQALYGKPVEEWDMEELARGRPRASDGTFKGRAPRWLDRSLHEQIVKRFEEIVRAEMNGHTVDALAVIGKILTDEGIDDKGKPRVPAGTKLEAAKFLVEHVVGKPKQRTETDISIKLQGILGHAMMQPTADGQLGLTQGYIEAEAWEDDDDEPRGD